MNKVNLRTSQQTPIGLDFDFNEFRAVQFDSPSAAAPSAMLTIPRQGRRSLVPSVDELQSLAASLYQRGFQSNKIAIGVPKETSSFHIIELPPAKSGAPVHQLALIEAQRSGAHTTNDLQIGYWTHPPKDPPSKFAPPYYMVASETEALDEIVDRLEEANLLPISIEPIETALTRSAFTHEECTDDSIHSIVEIGWDHSWAVISLGSVPVYTRKISIGTSRIRRQLIDDHAMPAHTINTLLNPNDEIFDHESKVGRILYSLITPMLTEITNELDTALTYVSQQHRFAPFGAVFRSGYFADLDQTAHAIASRTGMPTISLALQSDHTQCASLFEQIHSPRLSIAAGLAKGAAA